MNYRIERRHGDQPTGYWNAHRGSWLALATLATAYTEDERRDMRRNPLPAGGVWVVIDEPASVEHLGDLFVRGDARLHRNPFTVIKLRPVSIHLSATAADYDTLNAQALEFEAAVRQFCLKQQILVSPEWGIDVICEEE